MLKICAPPRVLLCPRSNPPLHHWEETGKQEKGETILVPDSAAATGTMTAVTKAIKVVAAAMAGASEGSCLDSCSGSQSPQQPQQHSGHMTGPG